MLGQHIGYIRRHERLVVRCRRIEIKVGGPDALHFDLRPEIEEGSQVDAGLGRGRVIAL
jgi:hypothetical protein